MTTVNMDTKKIPLIFIVLELCASVSDASSYSYEIEWSTKPDLESLISYGDCTSSMECARKCAHTMRNNVIVCKAFTFDAETQSCVAYKILDSFDPLVASPGLRVYRSVPSCDQTDGFQEVKFGDQLFCYAVFKGKLNFTLARDRCSFLGGYLLSFDSETEVKAITSIPLGSGAFWVGADDMVNEGVWVSVKSGDPIPSFWPWRSTEPGGGTNENCAAGFFVDGAVHVNDMVCDRTRVYVCERST